MERDVEPVSFDDLLTTADVVSLHLPLIPTTRGLFGKETIARMKQGDILINTEHGNVVDEIALATAVRTGHLAGAAIDVFSREPLPAASPLAGLANVWLTPHIAGLSREANPRASAWIAEQVSRSLARLTEDRAVSRGRSTRGYSARRRLDKPEVVVRGSGRRRPRPTGARRRRHGGGQGGKYGKRPPPARKPD